MFYKHYGGTPLFHCRIIIIGQWKVDLNTVCPNFTDFLIFFVGKIEEEILDTCTIVTYCLLHFIWVAHVTL